MIDSFLRKKTTGDDAKLREVLKRYDPVAPLSGASLAALEADILAQVAKVAVQESVLAISWPFAGIFQQGWGARAAAFASVLILASGFIVGQVFYGAEGVSAGTGSASLVAFADEAAGQFMPIVTDTSWGENDDNAE